MQTSQPCYSPIPSDGPAHARENGKTAVGNAEIHWLELPALQSGLRNPFVFFVFLHRMLPLPLIFLISAASPKHPRPWLSLTIPLVPHQELRVGLSPPPPDKLVRLRITLSMPLEVGFKIVRPREFCCKLTVALGASGPARCTMFFSCPQMAIQVSLACKSFQAVVASIEAWV